RDEGLVIDVRGFDGGTRPYSGELADTLATEPDGAASDLAAAIASAADDGTHPGEQLAAVIVLSDGLVGGSDDEAATHHLLEVAKRLGAPVTTVSVGAPILRDIAVADVRAGEFAFVENVAEFDATIISHGLGGQAATVELRRNGETVGDVSLRLRGDGTPQTVRFEVAPDRVGQFVYEIVVSAHEGEATLLNNGRAFVVKVLRDKVRVLHVAGRPDWDVRALRTLLRRDPNVELLSYYILRGFDDIAREDTDALSLIPFPVEELFEQELGSFDLVILHNFDAVPHQVAQYVDNIAQFVEDGGALVLIGGDLGFSDGGYGTPAMQQLLPIDLRRPVGLERSRFRPQLTEAGRRHPITAWLLAGDGRGWEALPELDTFNPVALADRADALSATTLLAHPGASDRQGRPRPLLAVSEPGKGRVVALATGSTWRLGFAPDLALVDGARPYDLLWLGVVRWLLRDESSGRLQLETDKPRYREGERVELRAKTLTAAYAPEPDVALEWRVLPLAGEAAAAADAAATEPDPVRKGGWTTDDLGRAQETLEDLEAGAYAAVAVRAAQDGSDDPSEGRHEARRVFIVEPPGRELARIDADPGIARLRELADATGGAFVDPLAGGALPIDLAVGDPQERASSVGRVQARRELALWGGPGALVVLVVAFGAEWFLRRRHGGS
ncbi:MAG TPA: hypothetical protein VFG69_18825, partial [Nannocystaceae bacterium]|nr:hypothetical protein [Nannocystaceae bacterium]